MAVERSKIRVLIVDDHAVVRAGLRLLVEQDPGMEVVGEAGTVEQGVELTHTAAPDVILLDINMPDRSGIRGIKELSRAHPPAAVLILTMHDTVDYVRAALAEGASGFVAKRCADERLLEGIRSVNRGECYVQARTDPAAPARRGVPNTLSTREGEVLRYVALGYTGQQVASELGISTKSVDTYRSRIMQKLGFESRVDLVRYALERGIIAAGKGTDKGTDKGKP